MENTEKTKNWKDFFNSTNEYRSTVKEMQEYIAENISKVKDESQLKLIHKIVKNFTDV